MYACLCLHADPHAGANDAAPLVALARDFSPRYEQRRDDVVVVDVSGLGRLLGDARTIGWELRRSGAARGLRVHVAIAGTCTAALVLAHAGPDLTVIDPGQEAAALAPLPMAILEKVGPVGRPIEPPPVSLFASWGLGTLGDLAALPAAAFASRLGRAGLVWQAIARGEDVRPLVPTLPEERFESSLELEWPIEGLEPLSFVLTRLLEPVSTRLERRDRGAAVLHVLLGLVTRETHVCRLQLPTPIRDVRTLRTLALLDLESRPPAAAIDRVAIVVDPTPGRVLQHTLFTRAQPTPEQLSTLLARLGAVMGQDRVGEPAVIDSYRPGAFAMQPFTVERSTPGGPRITSPEPRVVSALRRCRHPVPARVVVANGEPVRVTLDRGGLTGGRVVTCAGPWRTSGAWWGAGEETGVSRLPAWDRDEWDVTLGEGAVCRIFCDRTTNRWFIDAIVD